MKIRKLFNFPWLFISFILAVCAASIFRALREVWVFYTPNMKFVGGAPGLFVILICNIAFITALLIYNSYSKTELPDNKLLKTVVIISCVITGLSVIAAAAIAVFNGAQTNSVMLMYLKRDLTVIIPFVALILLLISVGKLTGKARIAVISAALAALSAVLIIKVFPLKDIKITSDPCVMDTGDEYSVVFSTNRTGTAYIQYSYNGKEYKIYEQENGRRLSGRQIHSIAVPYDHLNNNEYSIGTTRVTDDYSYGSRLGKTAEKGPYEFKRFTGEYQKYLVISDWHSYLKKALSAIAYQDKYDAVILLGDPAAGMDFEEEAVRYIVEFGGTLTKGKIPIIYVRGNHETRGSFAAYMPEYLGYNKLYYTVDRGPYSFIILDSGEDKEDSHIEYGGLDDYAVNRNEVVDWLETVSVSNEKIICLCHAWQVSEPEENLSLKAWDILNRLGVDFMLSGHTHECRFIDGANDREKEQIEKHPDIPVYIDGGYSDGKYIASAISLSPDEVKFEAYDNSGNKIMDKTIPWD